MSANRPSDRTDAVRSRRPSRSLERAEVWNAIDVRRAVLTDYRSICTRIPRQEERENQGYIRD